MGTTAKIWPATDEQVQQCLSAPETVDTLFWRAAKQEHSLIHNAQRLKKCLLELVALHGNLHTIVGAEDPTFVMSPDGVREMFERRSNRYQELLQFGTIASNKVDISDVALLALKENQWLIFCIFEDW